MSYYGVNARLDVALAYRVCLELNPIIDMIRHLKEEAFSKTRVLGLPGRATEVSGWRELTSIEPLAWFHFQLFAFVRGILIDAGRCCWRKRSIHGIHVQHFSSIHHGDIAGYGV